MLHCNKWPAIEFADLIDRDYIGMIELGRRLRFSFEPGAAVGILTEMGGKEFERDRAIELGVLGKVYLTHPAGADLLDDPVVPD